MDRETAIQKIKKCLALAGSSNPHEAANAMRQAQKLMGQFDVSDVELSMADVQETARPARSNTIASWEAGLARLIADAFGCDMFINRRGTYTLIGALKRKTEFRFVGISPAADVAAYAFEVLYRQAQRDRQAHIAAQRKSIKQSTKTARGDAFSLAWVMGVGKLVDQFAGKQEQDELVLAYMKQQHPEMTSFSPSRRHLGRHVRNDSYAAGAKAGSQAKLDRALSGSQGPTLIGG